MNEYTADGKIIAKGEKEKELKELIKKVKWEKSVTCGLISLKDNINFQKTHNAHIYKPFLDMAIVYKAPIIEEGNETGRAWVNKNVVESFFENEEELYSSAYANNTKKEVKLYSMEDVMTSIISEVEETNLYGKPTTKEIKPMYVLKNDEVDGAAVILIDKAMKDVRDYLGEDYYVLPSSKHEIIIVPTSVGATPEELREMVIGVNETEVEAKDKLTDSVYFWSEKENKLVIA